MICRVCPARSSCAGARKAHPFRIFFILAAADATVSVALWLPKLLGFTAGNVAGVPLIVWHRDEILFGMMPAVLAGFVLTALPRWTRGAPVTPAQVMLLAGLWLAGRVVHSVSVDSFAAVHVLASALAFVFVGALTLMAARQIGASRAWREIKVVLLLAGFTCAAGLALLRPADATSEMAMRLGLACVLALVVVLGGRIAPALTAAWLKARGQSVSEAHSRWLDTTAALTVAVALGGWAIATSSEITAVASAFACVTQAGRLALWKGWRAAGSAPVLALHVAYGWIPAGFALHAAAVFWPSFVSQAAAVHAWAIGAIGLMSVAVMASMIRRHSRTPFAVSGLMSLSLASVAIAAPARIAAEIIPDGRQYWLILSALGWVAGFALFLLAFRNPLLRRRDMV
ncbi:MAG: NnrS family protein [Hyphomicrobium sp.]|uniref:NnrS family protein n=1 Tax=Hyphomicrobium sp. TaxID=82 RepID=UPI0035661DB8